MPITETQCREILYRAIEAEIGVAVEVDAEDVMRTKNLLYATRRAIADPVLDSLIVFEPEPIDGVHELFVCKKETELPDA